MRRSCWHLGFDAPLGLAQGHRESVLLPGASFHCRYLSTPLAWPLCDSPGLGWDLPPQPHPHSQSMLQTSLDSQGASHCLLNCCSGSRLPVPYAGDSHLNWSPKSKSITLKWLQSPERKSRWGKWANGICHPEQCLNHGSMVPWSQWPLSWSQL